MNVYAVKSYNLDVPSDGIHTITHYAQESDAYKRCLDHIKEHNCQNVVEDVNGTFKNHNNSTGVSLEFKPCKNRPAIYYDSYFGNYKCVVYVDTIRVH